MLTLGVNIPVTGTYRGPGVEWLGCQYTTEDVGGRITGGVGGEYQWR